MKNDLLKVFFSAVYLSFIILNSPFSTKAEFCLAPPNIYETTDNLFSDTPCIVLIGCGTWALSSHMKSIADNVNKKKCSLFAIVDFSDDDKARKMKHVDGSKDLTGYKKYCGELGINPKDILKPMPHVWSSRVPSLSEVDKYLSGLVKSLQGRKVGVIISTPEIYHKVYLQWALKHSYHVLVDKPITINPYTSTKITAARLLVKDAQYFIKSFA